MANDFIPIPGDLIKHSDLRIPKALGFASIISTVDLPYVSVVECRLVPDTSTEIVVFDTEVQLGQKIKYDIHDIERIAVIFKADDSEAPLVIALRTNFPKVPHLYPETIEFPTILCLYEEEYSELKLHWTPIGFLERIRDWLALNAKGKLHGEDQPLEPLLTGSQGNIVVPLELFEEKPNLVSLKLVRNENGRVFLNIEYNQRETKDQKLTYLAITLKGAPQPHGLIRRVPNNVLELHEFLTFAKLDVISALRKTLIDVVLKNKENKKLLDPQLIILLALPKTKTEGDVVESIDIWAFLTALSVREIGKELGIWNVLDGEVGLVFEIDETKNGKTIDILPLNPTLPFSRERASILNGKSNRENKKIVAIGLGALGSQIFINLVRSGYGEWTLIDNDSFFPHNLARHALYGFAVGYPKTETLAHLANTMIYGEPIATPIVADVLEPGEDIEKVNNSLKEAALILDMSTSIAVARHLSRDNDSQAQRISMFLNPSGTDVVMLAEGLERKTPLDFLEMQYYRAMINDPLLEGHLTSNHGRVRYANSCRDVSSTISQDLVALHAAICSRVLPRVISEGKAQISIWQTNVDDLTVNSKTVTPEEMVEIPAGDWIICTDKWLYNKIFGLRFKKLPYETGGILIGSFDIQRKIVYVVDTVPSPPDSKEWPTVYIRGCQGLSQRVEQIEIMTNGMLTYVGEWHSHPDNCSCRPSSDDFKAFTWLSSHMNLEGYPGLMLIAGQNNECSWYVGKMI